jgi:L-ribulokinase
VLVNAELGGITLGWNLTHTAADELFAAIEGTAFHTRIILDRMSEHGVPQKNETLNRVYANVLGKPVLVPQDEVTSLGSAIFAFLAAGTFQTIEDAKSALPELPHGRARPARRRGIRAPLSALPEALFRLRPAGLRAGGDRRGAARV